jgi:hypothetical protein
MKTKITTTQTESNILGVGSLVKFDGAEPHYSHLSPGRSHAATLHDSPLLTIISSN